MNSAPAEKPTTERQRWMAAQLLSRGQRVVRAAAAASMPPTRLRELLADDEDFRELVEAEREQVALSPEEWQREMVLAHRQAIERALADGRVSIVGQLLRLGLALPALARQVGSRQAAERTLHDLDEEDENDDEDDENANFLESDDGIDDATWLAGLPVVEAEPEREAERRRKLMEIKFRQNRRQFGAAPLARIEKHLVIDDPVAYEEWFARQPKPPRNPAKSLTAADAALVERVTRDNPPWIRGPYLGYHRPPVPAHLFLSGATGDEPAPAMAEVETAAPETPASLRARVLRLLDRSQPRLPEELALAEAICALRWPNWPAYHGPLDLDLLRLALDPIAIDATTLHWLDSHELAKACRSTAVEQPQGP